MKFQLVLHTSAESEILASATYYEGKKEGLGLEFLDELENVKIKLSEQPNNYAYISSKKTFRSISLNRFPFKLIYEVLGNRVIINAARHDKRKPL